DAVVPARDRLPLDRDELACGRRGHRDREARAVPGPRGEMQGMLQAPRDAFDDRKPKAEAGFEALVLAETFELLKDDGLVLLGNTRTRIMDLDAQAAVLAAATHEHVAVARVFDRVGDEILQHPAQELAIGSDRERRSDHGEGKTALGRRRPEFAFEGIEKIIDAEDRAFGAKRSGIETRYVEESGKDVLDGAERSIDVADQFAVGSPRFALDQARREEPRGIERLQDVVACCGDE